jgi:DNA polymerase-3 subunit delta'
MLLKTLEESAANILFILVTDKPHLLLPTITSRCWEIKFSPLRNAEIEQYLCSKFNLSHAESRLIVDTYAGNISSIIDAMLNEQFIEKINVIDIFRYVWKSEFHSALQLLDKSSVLQSKSKASIIFEKFQYICSQLIAAQINPGNLSDEIVNLARTLRSDGIKDISSYCIDAITLLNSNININLLWTNLFIKIKKSFIT